MDSALREQFLWLLGIDLVAVYMMEEPSFWPPDDGPNGQIWWPIYRRWWTERDPRPVIRT